MAPKTFKLVPGWLPPDFDASGGGRVDLGVGVEIKADGSGGSPTAAVMAMTLSPEGSAQVPNRLLDVVLTLNFWGPDVPNQRLSLTATAGARRLPVPDPRYGFEERTLGGRTVILREADQRSATWNEDDVNCRVHSKGVSRSDLHRFITELLRVEPVDEPPA